MKKLMLIIFVAFFGTGEAQTIQKWKITDYENFASKSDEGILVVNFWATFCKPCVAEIPGFISVTDKYSSAGVKLSLVSLDLPSEFPAKIAAFAKKNRFTPPIYWLSETDADYFCPKIDSSWSGSIPATIFINTKTGYRKFYEEEMTAAEFETALRAAIDGKKIPDYDRD